MNKKLTARALALLTAAAMLFGTGSAFADTAADTTTGTAVEETETTETTETADETTEETTEEAEDTRPEVDSAIVATIGDIQITAEETADLYSYVLEIYSYYGYDVTDESIASQLKQITLDAMVTSKVQEIMEQERGYFDFTDEEIAAFTEEAQATYDETYQSVYDGFDDGETSEEDLKTQTETELATYGYTVEALVEQAEAQEAYNRLYADLTSDITVSDDDVTEYYAELVAEDKATYENDPDGYTLQCMYGDRPTYTPEGIRTVKHILIQYEDEDAQAISELEALSEKPDDYDEQYQALIETAYANIKDKVDEVMQKIADGEDFDALVEEYGEDPGMESEPYKSEGYMIFDGCTNLVEEFVTSGMALEKVGDITTEPALTSYGAHIMLYYSDLTPGEVELTDEKAEELRETLLSDKQSQAFDDAVTARTNELGTVYTYPENVIEAVYDDADTAEADAEAESDTLVIDSDTEATDTEATDTEATDAEATDAEATDTEAATDETAETESTETEGQA